MSRQRWKRSDQVRIVKPSGHTIQDSADYGLDLLHSGRAILVQSNPFTIAMCIDHRDELKRQRGRLMDGVTRGRFNGKYTTSNPNRRMFPPRPPELEAA